MAKKDAAKAANRPRTLAELSVGTRNVTRYYVWVGETRYDTATEALRAAGMEKAAAMKMAGKVLSLLKKDGETEIEGAIWKAEARV